MNGGQDLGGMMGFGPIAPEANEPVFHAEWERRAFALTLAMAYPGGWTLDRSRFVRESLHPARYLASSYYEIWFAGLERLLAENGLASAKEITAGRPLDPAKPVSNVLHAEEVLARLQRGGVCSRAPVGQPAFAVGARIRARNMHPQGHTRLPRYARGKHGLVIACHGCHVFPDSNAHGKGEAPQWLYTVRFSGRELWGESAEAGTSVSIDAFESYLEAA